jgi:hypothetical protein
MTAEEVTVLLTRTVESCKALVSKYHQLAVEAEQDEVNCFSAGTYTSSNITIPTSYKQAMASPQKDYWKEACDE